MASDAGGSGGGVMNDFLFFLGILLLLFTAWVASGGPSRPISFAGPFLTPITGPANTSQPYGNPSSFSPFSSNITIGTGGVSVFGGTASNQGGVTLMRDASAAKRSDADEEYVTITVSYGVSGGVSTAGWRLVSEKTGASVAFPHGTEVPRMGSVNRPAPITLAPGDSAIVVSGRSPAGISFRENMCTGYLEERQDFVPSLAQQCPTPYQELVRVGDEDDEECAAYVRGISYCSADTDVPSNVSNACEAFVEKELTYNGCVAAHQSDEYFERPTWRVFLGARDDLFRDSGDTITLLDAEGKVIDSFSY